MASLDSHSKHTIGIEAEYTGLVVRPGDTLVVGFSRAILGEEFDDIRERFEKRLPGVKLAIMDHVAGMVVYRNEDEES